MLYLDLFIGRELSVKEKLDYINYFANLSKKYGKNIDIVLKGGIGTEDTKGNHRGY